jgi:hypothetical protein
MWSCLKYRSQSSKRNATSVCRSRFREQTLLINFSSRSSIFLSQSSISKSISQLSKTKSSISHLKVRILLSRAQTWISRKISQTNSREAERKIEIKIILLSLMRNDRSNWIFVLKLVVSVLSRSFMCLSHDLHVNEWVWY